MKDNIQNEKTFDNIFWSTVMRMKEYFIPLVNEAFGLFYTNKATVNLKSGKQVVMKPNASMSHREMDSFVELSENDTSRDYHFEVESKNDKTIAIRIAQYAAGAAYDSIQLTENGAKLTIPSSAVIFLRGADSIPNKIIIEIDYPGGRTAYEAPAIKIKRYSIQEILDKRLLLLLPFFGFIFEDKFKEMNSEGIDEIKQAFEIMIDGLSKMREAGEIDAAQHRVLIQYAKRVMDKLTVNYVNVTKGVDELMGGYLIRTDTDDILEQGEAIGADREQRERIEIMLRDGKTAEQIADFCKYPIALVKEVEQSILEMA